MPIDLLAELRSIPLVIISSIVLVGSEFSRWKLRRVPVTSMGAAFVVDDVLAVVCFEADESLFGEAVFAGVEYRVGELG